MREVCYIVLHCTATPQTATVQSILRFWRERLGWRSPGYHKLIEPDGTVTELASPKRLTNGVRGHNRYSYHIAYIGGQGGVDNRTLIQKTTMEVEVKKALALFPSARVVGHRDLSPDKNGNGIIEPFEWTKLCPSFNVALWLREIGL